MLSFILALFLFKHWKLPYLLFNECGYSRGKVLFDSGKKMLGVGTGDLFSLIFLKISFLICTVIVLKGLIEDGKCSSL